MFKKLRTLTSYLALVASLAALLPVGAMAAANTLTESSFAALPGEKVHVTLKLSEAAVQPGAFTMDHPARIVFDFPDTASTLTKRAQTVGVGMLESISAVEAGGRTRVVLNLVQATPYETRVEGNEVHIFLDSVPASATTTASGAGAAPEPASGIAPPVVAEIVPATTPATSAKKTTASVAPSGGPRSITDIDFRRGATGEGRILITLTDPATTVDLDEQGGKVVLRFVGATLPESLNRRLDVTDFATPVTQIDTATAGNDVRMVVSAAGDYDYLSYQADQLLTVEFKPMTKAEKEKQLKDEERYTGDKLSLNFQNIEVRAVLQLLADFTGLNLVASDSVTGSVTLRLKNVPWDQALDIILRTRGLSKRQTGNVVMVAPTEEIAAREKLELEATKQIEELAPVRSEFVQINYAKAADMATLLKTKENRLLSERGNVSVDDRTNTLLVQDTPDRLEDIRRLVARLDIPVRQVLIESRIVIANNDYARDLGVKLGIASVNNQGGNNYIIGGALPGDLASGAITGGTIIENPAGSGNEALVADLPASGATSGVNLLLGRISGQLLRLELNAMQAEGRGEVISSPRVITANQHEATIKQGVEIPYQEATAAGAGTSTSFKEAVLSLKVTPQITPDDRIIMDLTINKDRPDFANALNGVPPIETQEVQTQVLVDNGETVVLGGIFEREKTFSSNSVPFFGTLPGIGRLFRQELNVDDNRELLVFVTPKLLSETLTAR